MRIHVKEPDGKNINFRIPNRLLMNRIMAHIGSAALKNAGDGEHKMPEFSAADIHRLFRTLLAAKRKFPGIPLVEVNDHNGSHVLITL